ncbi:Peptidase, M23/M37 family [Roseibacterium elongatum DSM 19469]|uniref:Peptidase, M23/M37 family n=1 Tax=Roseicyclus elongatus DSM 19469 TaxID=1294273 RepID=W8SLD5_9RHOB|nr:peptidase M23 [Roseibacterium elongatum]AHM03355.1 Peptidase, M23/M37 family [Roseibacterium elongatum DSM 19469]
MKLWAQAILLAAALLTGGTGLAQTDAAETAARAARLLDEAAASLADAGSARDRVEALTQTVRAYEEGLLAMRGGVRQAALRERTILLLFEAERDRLARLLAVLQSIEAAPAPLLLLHPEGPVGTARSGMIVSEVAPAVADQAMALRAQLEELALLRALQENALRQLGQGLEGAQQARADLSQAIADRRDLPPRFDTDPEAMRQILENADSLDSFAEILSADPRADAADRPDFAQARGALRLPVLGALLRRYDETDAAGVRRPGIVLATYPRALVTAPWPATIRYAGPLLDYGNVIILEPDADYLLVLGGLGDLYVVAGQLVGGDTALGLMPGPVATGGELIVSDAEGGGAGLSETLYMELREAGSPVDPGQWFIID